VTAATAQGDWHEDTQGIMGTRVRAEIWHEDAEQARRLLAAVMTEMRRIEAAYSPFRESSELSRINRDAPLGWVDASDEMLDLLGKSRQMSELTGGAFDITFGSLGRYYDYRERRRPDKALIEETLEAINYEYVEIDPVGRRVRFGHPAVYIDLGGIAKGYAVDRCIDLLIAAGVTEASVAAGGDSRILGDRRGQPWNVGVLDPRAKPEVAVLLPLMDTAVSTSGDYERYFEEDGVRYHHILDPATGDSARASMSVTILGPLASFTDALSTSVFVLGPEKGLSLINRLDGIDAIVIDAEGRMRYSADLEKLTP
jgi:thiamine biosynthesis lipoprotein